jgi:IS5 family transposase
MDRYIITPYFQHFCREIYFQYDYPYDPSDYVHFHKSIGEEGIKAIFIQSIDFIVNKGCAKREEGLV